MKAIKVHIIMLSLMLAMLLPGLSWGQANGGGSVSGAIYDSTGSVVSNAVIEVTNNATGVTSRTESSPSGQFDFPVLSVGAYSLRATKAGFATTTINNVIVSLAQTTSETLALQVGGTSVTVEVSGSPAGLNTTTPETTTGLDQDTYASLPVPNNGGPRSIVAVSTLAPGVAVNASTGDNNGSSPRSTLVVSGGQGYSGQSQIDGVTYLTSNTSSDFFAYQPVPLEALSEFALIQNNFSAQYGRTPGGVLSFNSRSGTNDWHGQIYEFNENTDLNARSYFATTRSPTVQNEYGGSIGGPIVKNKAFFFAYFGGYRFSGASPSAFTTIPTPAELTGDFSSYLNASGNVIPIYDPSTTQCNAANVCTRQQFPGNKIPASRILPVAQNFIPYIPTPINSNQTNNYLFTPQNTNDATQYGGKVDYTFGQHDTLHSFFGAAPFTANISITQIYKPPFYSGGVIEPDDGMFAIISEDHTFSASLLNHFAFGYSRTNESYPRPGYNSPVSLGIGNIAPSPPLLYFTEYPGVGSVGQNIASNGFDYNDFVSLTRGNHEIQAGGEFQRIQGNTKSISVASFNFADFETNQPTAPTDSGNSFASFLLGDVDSASEAYTPVGIGTRYSYVAAYIQDNWKLKTNLTLNIGVRYEIPFTRTQTHDTLSSFEPNVPNAGAGGILGALAFAGGGGAPHCDCQRFSGINYSGVQPRLGFVYSLHQNIIIRAGAGLFEATTGDVIDNGWRTQFSDGVNASPSFASPNLGVTPAFNINSGFPVFQLPPFIEATLDNGDNIPYLAKRNGTTGRISIWTFDVQNAFPGGFVFDLGYVGNSGHHLGSAQVDPNQVNPAYLSLGNTLNAPLSSAAGEGSGVPLPYPGFSGTVAQALRPYPQYLNVEEFAQDEGNSSYNALQAKLQRQIRNGPWILVSYTWAKVLSDSDYSLPEAAGLVGGGQNSFDPRSERGLSTLQPPQVVSIAYVWSLPFGKGQRYLGSHSVASGLLGGWQLTGIQTYRSGEPFAVNISNTLPIFNAILRPNRVQGVSLKGYQGRFNPATSVYLNPAAFSIPAPFSLGDVRRTVDGIRSFAYYDEDFGLGRNVHLTEKVNLFLQVNAFNTFNRVIFGGPNTSGLGTNPSFGQIGSQGNAPRLLQLQGKVTF